ncbi:MAG: serine--tRNA ligase [Bacteroidetes bacterium SW_4_67_19]|nr:MAG: serine--tRNA ligase [Bacteroidetes bacterium SW_4_67_19]
MIDIELIRSEPERVREAMRAKGLLPGGDAQEDPVACARRLDKERRERITRLQEAQEERNDRSGKIGELMRAGEEEKAQEHIARTKELKQQIGSLEDEVDDADDTLQRLLLDIPNLPHPSVPVGASEDDNAVEEETGEKPNFAFDPRPHWALAEQHDLVDFERGSKVTGAGFPFYTGRGARLQRALVQLFLDEAAEAGYREMQPPLFVNEDSARGTGQLPDKEDLMYEIGRDALFPIPTAEVPVTNFFRGDILAAGDLPVKRCAHTPCFRREAGSYGKDVRGLNRLHQFDKVELVWLTRPDESYRALEQLRTDAERPLDLLGLPYRRLLMCTGDMGFAQAKKYDLEVWSAGQERWLEVSSVSNFESFQARRARIRYREEPEADPQLVHTLNGSALALPRVIAALLEHYQTEDGTVELPDVLSDYTGFERIG